MRFVFKTNYRQDVDLFEHNGQRFWYGLLMLALLVAPLFLGTFYLGELALVLIYAIAGIGLMLLVGYTGLVSLGHAAFLAIGAYTHAWLLTRGWPFPLSLLAASLFSAAIGAIVGLPAMRMTGIYLAIATLAFAIIVEQVIAHWETITGGYRGMPVPKAEFAGLDLSGPAAFFYLCLLITVVCLLGALNLLRSPTGRAMAGIRDSEISAQSMGIDLARTKSIAFAVSAGFTGLAGGLFAHKLGYLAPDAFTLLTSIQLLLMVVVGGLGSMHGVFYGAIFIGLLPQGIAMMRDSLPSAVGQLPGLEPGLFGLILVLFLIYEPLGIYGRWRKIRQFFEEFPLYRKATHKRQKQYLRTERVR
ncbi:MAG: branched-chain amino acid ABC transporter permease [Gammaproteobacteria bacterium]|nr:branched-chain amino acid ABC transporter permease [Gammaproteobacteria bacterium]